jgi:hypothetical protein
VPLQDVPFFNALLQGANKEDPEYLRNLEHWTQKMDSAFKISKRSKGLEKEFWEKYTKHCEYEAIEGSDPSNPKYMDIKQTEFGTSVNFHDGTIYTVHRNHTVTKIEYGPPITKLPIIKLPGIEINLDKGNKKRPVEPGEGEGDCVESDAQRRARAIHNCIFGGSPDLSTGGSLDPLVRPSGPAGPPSPQTCNEVNMAALWGSSTASGGGATDPRGPEDLNRRGPSIFDTFVPARDGVIDPVKAETPVNHSSWQGKERSAPGQDEPPTGNPGDPDF